VAEAVASVVVEADLAAVEEAAALMAWAAEVPAAAARAETGSRRLVIWCKSDSLVEPEKELSPK
jgi:hypothetical protein